ncbi:hypothetical protein CBM2598_U10031 [Cupriavidus taiwanensis]|nr:hypothetical protein CBM2598_U10031 [Cupriavidus taiwanensis]
MANPVRTWSCPRSRSGIGLSFIEETCPDEVELFATQQNQIMRRPQHADPALGVIHFASSPIPPYDLYRGLLQLRNLRVQPADWGTEVGRDNKARRTNKVANLPLSWSRILDIHFQTMAAGCPSFADAHRTDAQGIHSLNFESE